MMMQVQAGAEEECQPVPESSVKVMDTSHLCGYNGACTCVVGTAVKYPQNVDSQPMVHYKMLDRRSEAGGTE